jgi:LPS-assembly lipoprotein
MNPLPIRTGSLILVWLTLTLSACGFHLRGDVQIDPVYSPLIIEPGNLSADQQDMLRQALLRASAIIVDDSSKQANRLQLNVSKLLARNVARSNVTAVTLVQLTMTLQFSLLDATGHALVDAREITESMEIERDDNNLLVHQQQLDRAAQRLYRQLLKRMISQLSDAA